MRLSTSQIIFLGFLFLVLIYPNRIFPAKLIKFCRNLIKQVLKIISKNSK